MSKRISLQANHLEALTRGEIVEVDGVQIALSDIGFDSILRILQATTLRLQASLAHESHLFRDGRCKN